MADEPTDHTLRILRKLDQKLDKLSLQLSDLTDSVHRIEADIGGLRGSVAALRHDVKIYSDRWSDLEVRVRAIEAAD